MKKYLLYFLFSTTLFAHPHTFIDVYPSLQVQDSKTHKITFEWKIDEMTSTMLMMDIDSDGNGKIDKKENKFIEENYFNVFSDYDYYTYIKVDNKTIKFPIPQNFRAKIENNRVVYSFDILGDFDTKNTVVEFGDSDFYVAMVLKDKFIHVDGAKAKAIGVDNDFYYGYRLEFN